jgi:hypothetical protein
MEEGTVEEKGIGTGTLTGVRLAGKINISKTG